MTMAIEIPSRERYEQAAEWLLKVQAEGAPPEVFVEMLAWCDLDPLNKAAMERIEEAWAVTGEVELDSRLRGNDKEGRGDRQGRGNDGRWRLAASFAGIALLVALAALGLNTWRDKPDAAPGERVVTARGGHEKATLSDGSRVELGGKSSMSVVYSPQQRVIVAEDGEAFFSVSKDPGRPFIVRAGPVTVTAVGTAFSVRRSGESVSVVVTEGIVEVATEKLAVRAEAGQRVRYDRGQLSQSLDEVPLEVATSWREGRLQFVDEPLRLVIASVNRYSEREVLISDPSIEELRFTGTVFEKGVENWLQGVASVFPVRIVPVDKRRVMIAPAQN
jgi:transmembrane sensor